MDLKGVQFGRYFLQRLIARGGMGELYLASLVGVAGFEKKCVIKKIRADLASDPSFVERFLNEGRTLVALTHSNIVQIFDMGAENGEYYLAMEYVQGGDLRYLLKRVENHRLPLNVAIGVAIEALKGLSYAHNATDETGRPLGIVHRDVSTSNILISRQGEVKLIDFGIAKARTIESVSGIVQGKFAYMSPEQARGESLDRRTDVFSMGVVLYEMLCGRRPFEGNSDLQALERIKTGNYLSLSQVNPEADEALDEILDHALDKNRDTRFGSADEFYDALVEYSRSHDLSWGQRENMAYFTPFFGDETPSGSVDMVMGAAIDRMLNAQAMGGTQTCTLMPTPHTGSSQVSAITGSGQLAAITGSSQVSAITGNSQVSAITGNSQVSAITGNSQISAITGRTGSGQIVSGTISSENLAEIPSELLEVVDVSNIAATPEVRRTLRIKKVRTRIRYLMLGALLAFAAIVVISIFYWRIDSLDTARTLREALLTNTLPQQDVPAAAQETAADAGNVNEMSAQQLVFNMYHIFQKGIPLHVETAPENATIYIIEGSYRKLEDKNVELIPGSNAVIAVQAPGYETCMLHFYFDSNRHRSLQNTDWQNCRSVSTRFLSDTQRIELSVTLNSIRTGWDNHEIAAKQDSAQAETPIESAEKPETAQNLPSSSHKTTEPRAVKTPKKTSKTPEKPQSSGHSVVSQAFKSNIPAEAVVKGERTPLPATIEAEKGTPIQIVPTVKGRKIGIAYTTTISGASAVQTDFCEATIRIRESYVGSDPAPYQISDISVDSVLRARQTDAAFFVLPCGKHTFTANTSGHAVKLSASVQATLEAGKPYATALTLAP